MLGETPRDRLSPKPEREKILEGKRAFDPDWAQLVAAACGPWPQADLRWPKSAQAACGKCAERWRITFAAKMRLAGLFPTIAYAGFKERRLFAQPEFGVLVALPYVLDQIFAEAAEGAD